MSVSNCAIYKRYMPRLMWSARALAVLAVLFLLWACDQETETRFAEINVDKQPTHLSRKPVIRLMDSSKVKAIIKAGQARVYEERMETYLDSGVTVEFLSKTTGKRVSILTADSARIDEKTNDMMAGGNVVVIADSSGTVLRTELLMWSEKRRKLHTTKFVDIRSPQEEIQGYGFESDQYLKNYVIYKVSGKTYKQ